MEFGVNRIVQGMQEWMQREQNLAGLFSPSTLQTRYFQQLKLDYLRDLAGAVKKDASTDERMTLRILKGEMKEMERKLYPRPCHPSCPLVCSVLSGQHLTKGARGGCATDPRGC